MNNIFRIVYYFLQKQDPDRLHSFNKRIFSSFSFRVIIHLSFLSSSVLFYSCEDIDVIENQINYEETIIVAAELKANSKFTGVRFSRTLPINEEYDQKKAGLENVRVYLKQDGNKIIPLHYRGDGIYNSIYDLVPASGDIFELFAVYNNKSIYSKTIIPHEPFIESAVVTGDNFIEVFILPQKDEVYGALWLIKSDSTGITSPAFFNIYETTINTPGTRLYLRTDQIPQQYRGSMSNIYVRVTAFDKSFLDYFQTRNNNEPINDIFSQAGAPIKWNVHGDGVIGLFIGMAANTKIAK